MKQEEDKNIELQARMNFCKIYQNMSICEIAAHLPYNVVRDMNIAYGINFVREYDQCEPCEREKAKEFYGIRSKTTIWKILRKYGEFSLNYIKSRK